jgi:hypothetical protein
MPKAKPVSLHPLTFHEALKHLVKVDPDKVGLSTKRRKQAKQQPSSQTKNPKKSN